jgi:hypothetical protein
MPAVLASRGNHNHARAGVVVDIIDDLGQLVPEIARHAIESVGTFQLDMGDFVGDSDFKASGNWFGFSIVHNHSPELLWPLTRKQLRRPLI